MPSWLVWICCENRQCKNYKESKMLFLLWHLNPLTPMSDQYRISPYNISTISSRQVLRIN